MLAGVPRSCLCGGVWRPPGATRLAAPIRRLPRTGGGLLRPSPPHSGVRCPPGPFGPEGGREGERLPRSARFLGMHRPPGSQEKLRSRARPRSSLWARGGGGGVASQPNPRVSWARRAKRAAAPAAPGKNRCARVRAARISPPREPAMDAPARTLSRRRCRLVVCFLLLPLAAQLSGARKVHLPPGPLYRVEGTTLAIPCNVSEFEGPSLQQFEWFLYRPSAPDISIGMVSTRDPNFPYAVFGARVQAGNISILRNRGDVVELRVRAIRMEDAGVYECYTPTTDSKYQGTYSAKVEVRVIPDQLSVSAAPPSGAKPALWGRGAAPPPQLLLLESQDLLLTCSVASETQQHTHLSASFTVSAPGSPRLQHEVIGLRRDFALEAAGRFAPRRLARELSLVKLGDWKYQMALDRLKPEDSGTYHCAAGEWIQDPDGSWQQITEKRVALADVSVQSIASQLSVSAGPPRALLSPRDSLELFCNVSGAPILLLPQVAFAVSWELRKEAAGEGHLIARLEASGGLVLGQNYANRNVGTRHVSLQKLASPLGAFLLRIESAQPADMGLYRCQVQAFSRSPSAELRLLATLSSEVVSVEVKSQAVVLGAVAWLPSPTLYRGSTADVRCNVSVESAQDVHLALSWWAELPQPDSSPLGVILAAVDREGVAQLEKPPSGVVLSVDKVGPQSYRLRLHAVQPSDEGGYYCAVTAWVRSPDRSWYQAASAKSNVVTVYPYPLAMDTLLIPLVVGISSALLLGISILVSVTCCFMARLRKSIAILPASRMVPSQPNRSALCLFSFCLRASGNGLPFVPPRLHLQTLAAALLNNTGGCFLLIKAAMSSATICLDSAGTSWRLTQRPRAAISQGPDCAG
ncbi:immunoglobulin superfamily member 8 isoform X2 [Ahaetulla prasina]|nr:immunoglobulin superfamily member 8 isoform X2 [Ahaetulla prasina]XP_058016294.1 immunoglobulin superfamily member 8 isoform X2 [Ahaetulla prasina]